MRHANRVAWAGLASSNPELSTSFYLSLFGWGSYDIPLTGIGTLTMFTLGAEDVALAYRQTRQARDARVVPTGRCSSRLKTPTERCQERLRPAQRSCADRFWSQTSLKSRLYAIRPARSSRYGSHSSSTGTYLAGRFGAC
jgi:hypothetical protein